MAEIPHVIPYQGSKRKLAPQILSFVSFKVEALYEPFAGSAAVTIAAAQDGIARSFVINDKLEPLAALWRDIIERPEKIASDYRAIWEGHVAGAYDHFLSVRADYNRTRSPAALLYLVARCVKNAVRFNAEGDFNQSPDKRRLGMHPDKFERAALEVSSLLKGRTRVDSGNFRESLRDATASDCVYMDPPWQGTSFTRDSRYAHLLDLDDLIAGLRDLNARDVPFMLSFDGTLGEKTYGEDLPADLELTLVQLHAGRSSQATLLGRDDMTIESLYLSPALIARNGGRKTLAAAAPQLQMFAT